MLGILVVAVLMGLGVAIWLALGRAGLVQAITSEQSRREAAETRVADIERQSADWRKQAEELSKQLQEERVGRGRLEQDIQAERTAHEIMRTTLSEKAKTDLTFVQERMDAEVAAAEERAKIQLASIEREKDAIRQQLEGFEHKLRDTFGHLASTALKENRESFLSLAEQKLESKRAAVDQLVAPIAETLRNTDRKLAIIEAAGLELKSETGKLVRALREPTIRGRYGEMQLKRVAELAGMTAYCDFTEQDQTRGADGAPMRPDMIVRMPSSRTIVIDAKTNIQAYLDAMSATTPEQAEEHLERFAKAVSDQATQLAKKKYWSNYDGSPEFVVMFIPGDQFIDAALKRQPDLLEHAAQQGVILASPATLIGLLRAVAVGYHEQQLAKAAEELRELGKQLHERVSIAMTHISRLGRQLNMATDSYNEFVSSYVSRLEPTLRKFEESGVRSGKDLPETPAIVVRAKDPAGQLRLLDA